MSAGVTIGVALAGSAFGGVVGSWLTTQKQITHEREESLRARMLEAADELARKVGPAMISLRDAVDVVAAEDLLDEDGHIDSTTPEAMLLISAARDAQPLVDDVRPTLPRISLLFGPDSPAGRAALNAVGAMSIAVLAMLDDLDVAFAEAKYRQAVQAHSEFTREARRAVLRPSLADPEPTRRQKVKNAINRLARSGTGTDQG